MLALAQRHLRDLYPKLQTVTTRLKKRWERLADTGASLDIVEEIKRFTVDVTTLIAFGYDINTVEQGDDVIQRKLELVFPAINHRLSRCFRRGGSSDFLEIVVWTALLRSSELGSASW